MKLTSPRLYNTALERLQRMIGAALDSVTPS